MTPPVLERSLCGLKCTIMHVFLQLRKEKKRKMYLIVGTVVFVLPALSSGAVTEGVGCCCFPVGVADLCRSFEGAT